MVLSPFYVVFILRLFCRSTYSIHAIQCCVNNFDPVSANNLEEAITALRGGFCIHLGGEEYIFGGASPLSFTQHCKLMYCIIRRMDLKGVTGYTFRHTIITDIRQGAEHHPESLSH